MGYIRVLMEQCTSREKLLRAPAGRWWSFGSGLFWCASPTLCGFAIWGRPGAAETRALMSVFDGYRSLAPRFDVVQDGRGIESIDSDALEVLLDWLRSNGHVLRDHVRERVAIVPRNVAGLALMGIQPLLALASPVRIVTDAREGFRALPEGGDALFEEVEQLVQRARGTPPVLLALRGALAEARGELDLGGAARRLGLSRRSLQRQLAQAGVSFRAEQADARFRIAEELLRGDQKLSTVAAQLGLSEDGLAELTRARAGCTPGELRRRLRGT